MERTETKMSKDVRREESEQKDRAPPENRFQSMSIDVSNIKEMLNEITVEVTKIDSLVK